MYLIYVDESGDEGRTVFSALAVPEHRWSSYLKGWLTWRKQLFRDHHVPASYELHAQDWLSFDPAPLDGGGAPAILERNRNSRRGRFTLFEGGIRVIGTFHDARLFTVEAAGTDKYELYAELLAWIDDELRADTAYGLVILDGLDQGHHFRRRHRDLPIKIRRILEDPVECPSHSSQLIQMVDWCVHAAFRHLRGTDDAHVVALYPNALREIIVVGSEEPSGIRHVP